VNPYAQFKYRVPDDGISGETLVYNGSFNVRAISGLSRLAIAIAALRTAHPGGALPDLQQAAALAPELLMPHEMLAALYAGAHNRADAEREYQTAMNVFHNYGAFAKGQQPPQDPLPQAPATLASNK
jgi:Tfp pilus assembly protein PilF